MSFGCITNYLSENFDSIFQMTVNGECRVLQFFDGSDTDEQGFIRKGYLPRTESFLKCSWTAKSADEKSEIINAGQTRALFGYEIRLPRTADGEAVVVEPSDRLEFKSIIGASGSELLEILGVGNMSNILWQIYAVDIKE